jgi:hypothetical protein
MGSALKPQIRFPAVLRPPRFPQKGTRLGNVEPDVAGDRPLMPMTGWLSESDKSSPGPFRGFKPGARSAEIHLV